MSEAHQMPMETQQQLRKLPGNNRCVDCDAPYPQWATVSYGTFMCLECSGRHRGLGVHISFVRSVTMDSWTDKQVQQMQQGGNDNFREAFAVAGVPTTLSISQKYNTPQAEAYRQRLTALVEGRSALPLPKWDPSSVQQPASSSSFSNDTRGVEALKGESEQDYVARQMRLRDEARARMQAKFGSNGMQGIGSGGETSAPASSGGVADLTSAFGYLTSTVTSVASTAASTAASLVKDKDLGAKVSSGWSYVQSTITDPALSQNVKSTASTGWSALSSGASAVWKTAQTVVDSTVNGSSQGDASGQFPKFNSGLAPSGKYSGIGSSQASSRHHDNDSWLDSQLGSSQPTKSSSSGGSSSNSATSYSSPHSNSFSSSSSSTAFTSSSSSSSVSSGFAPSSSGTSFSSTPAPVPAAAAPAPTPAPAPVEKKKDVDFFGEFGF
ncbi:Pde1 suppressor 1 family protein, partial [Globisporangium splendens]